jgi:hypothetical protein
LTVNTCTISGNRCENGGNGGLGFRGGSADGADGGSGGGIYSAGKLELSSCTVALNQGGTGGAGGERINELRHLRQLAFPCFLNVVAPLCQDRVRYDQ